MMMTLSMIRTKLTGTPTIQRIGETMRLEGYFPNPEKGETFKSVMWVLALLALLIAPALHYGGQVQSQEGAGDLLQLLFDGIAASLAPLLELVRSWEPGASLHDLAGWGLGLGLMLIIVMFTVITVELFRTLTDRPYLAVTVDADAVTVQRGRFGTSVAIPRDEYRAVHVGRRKSGAYEVLLQHGGTLTQLTIVDGNERRALLLKAKIDEMLND